MSQIPGYHLTAKSSQAVDQSSLFNGIILRWSALKLEERCVCVAIIAAPVWWLIGWVYIFWICAAAIIAYEVWSGKNLQLESPSGLVISAACFLTLRNALAIFASGDDLGNSTLVGLVNGFCFAFFLWYIESRKIRVRFPVLAWAFSILVVEILLLWIMTQLVLGAPRFEPPRTLLAQILAKNERYIPGEGDANYLIPYRFEDKLPGGIPRVGSFFPVPEDFALISGFVCLIALDLKKQIWKLPLFGVGIFMLFLSGTRSNWIVLTLILVLRYLIVVGKAGGPAILVGLFALTSFLTLSLPPVTQMVSNTLTNTTEATGNLRRDSTDVRNKIYQRTFEAIATEPEYLLLGRGVTGRTVLPGYEPAKVGSHSFILGSLIYRMGLIGTGVFLWFWVSLILTLYRTRAIRPLSGLLMVIYMSVSFVVMEISMINFILLLISILETNEISPKLPKKIHVSI